MDLNSNVGTQAAAVPGQELRSRLNIGPMSESQLDGADRIFRLSFGTFIGLPDPLQFYGDADLIRSRWRADPAATLAAELDGNLIASNIVTNWGSAGFFGPLTVEPAFWDRGVAGALMERTMDLFKGWNTRHIGLFTFPHSPKHTGLYQKFGFWPRFLTMIMSKPVQANPRPANWTKLSSTPAGLQSELLGQCRGISGQLLDGLDVSREINAVQEQALGDTVLLWEGDAIRGFAVCHVGAATEAGSGTCYSKIAMVASGPNGGSHFEALLDACENYAAERGATRLSAGVNTARHEAYRRMLARGFRTDLQGVAMHWNNDPGYNRPECLMLDDWR